MSKANWQINTVVVGIQDMQNPKEAAKSTRQVFISCLVLLLDYLQHVEEKGSVVLLDDAINPAISKKQNYCRYITVTCEADMSLLLSSSSMRIFVAK